VWLCLCIPAVSSLLNHFSWNVVGSTLLILPEKHIRSKRVHWQAGKTMCILAMLENNGCWWGWGEIVKKLQDECDRLTAVAGPCTDAPRHVVGCHLSPPIAGERVGVEGWGGNGHLLEAYSTKPTCKPQSTMCSFWDLRRYAVAVVAVAAAGRGKLKNVR